MKSNAGLDKQKCERQKNFLFFSSSKVNLEAEIIIYRYLLDTYGFGEKITVVPQKKIVAKEMTGKFIAKGRKKRSIGISKCIRKEVSCQSRSIFS